MARATAVEKCLPRKCTTRQTLIDAAHALIWANSYAHVSVEEICRAAGVQKGSFYHFFPTKIDLAIAAMENHWIEVQPKIEAIFSENHTPQAQLRALCAEILRKQADSLEATGKVCGCPYATMGAEMSGNNEQLRSLSQDMNDRFLEFYVRMLQHAVDANLIPARDIRERAREMHTYAIGAMLQARITNRLDTVGKSLEKALFRMSGIPEADVKIAHAALSAPQFVRKR